MVKLNQTYGLETPIQNSYPLPIVADRAPLTTDLGRLPGQIWLDAPNGVIYMLAKVAAGSADWPRISNV